MAGQNTSLLGIHNANYSGFGSKGLAGKKASKVPEEDMDDEDRYLDEIINRNYTKAPPAVV
jgi:hypothetical protein